MKRTIAAITPALAGAAEKYQRIAGPLLAADSSAAGDPFYMGKEPDAVYLPPGRLAAAIRFVLEVAAPAATLRSRSAMVAGSPSESTRRQDISPIARPYCRSTTSTVASDSSRRRWVIRLSRVRFGASSQKAAKDAPAPVATASIARRSPEAGVHRIDDDTGSGG